MARQIQERLRRLEEARGRAAGGFVTFREEEGGYVSDASGRRYTAEALARLPEDYPGLALVVIEQREGLEAASEAGPRGEGEALSEEAYERRLAQLQRWLGLVSEEGAAD